jgi:glyoxylase-like metal-dependent hydrolase (beta-lactamase superfamily II)
LKEGFGPLFSISFYNEAMKITKLNYQPDFCNTYVVGEEGGDCVVIDPGYNENHVLERYLQKHHKKVLGF